MFAHDWVRKIMRSACVPVLEADRICIVSFSHSRFAVYRRSAIASRAWSRSSAELALSSGRSFTFWPQNFYRVSLSSLPLKEQSLNASSFCKLIYFIATWYEADLPNALPMLAFDFTITIFIRIRIIIKSINSIWLWRRWYTKSRLWLGYSLPSRWKKLRVVSQRYRRYGTPVLF